MWEAVKRAALTFMRLLTIEVKKQPLVTVPDNDPDIIGIV